MTNTEEELLKQSFLITHGTIYGELPPSVDWVAASSITSTILGCCSSLSTWRSGLNSKYDAGFLGNGPMTNVVPIEVIHWNGNANAPYDTLTPWEQCVTLLSRF